MKIEKSTLFSRIALYEIKLVFDGKAAAMQHQGAESNVGRSFRVLHTLALLPVEGKNAAAANKAYYILSCLPAVAAADVF